MLTRNGSSVHWSPRTRPPLSQLPCLMRALRMIIFATLWAAAAGDALSPTAAISAEDLLTKTLAKVRC